MNLPAKPIMIQGTMSNVGKSVITAALCRILLQDGYRVAPFKSQNMALNSYITPDGFEIGRAQAVQAEAAGLDADVRMNPILLKPMKDNFSQVILNGEVYGNVKAADYFKSKKDYIPHILKAYESLAAENDIIVIEGAGSPAEINLNDNDIVNMGLAEMLRSPVILTADIDRGGVFATLYGTVSLLENYKKYFKGSIINKFRGDISILTPAFQSFEKRIEMPILGVIPFIDIDIDDEDSLSCSFNENVPKSADMDIAVIRLPHISNFTDFKAFTVIDGVSVRYISKPDNFNSPDILIIPGTKNTIGDLEWLKKIRLDNVIKDFAATGKPLIGICGGYQMMCEKISDPLNIEGGGTTDGLCLLNAKTVFEHNKVRTRVAGQFKGIEGYFSCLNGLDFKGYEIHMGKTSSIYPPASILKDDNGFVKNDGIASNNILGTYIHGIFDEAVIAEALINKVCDGKGVEFKKSPYRNYNLYKEEQYNKLAEIVRQAIDMNKVYKIIEKGI